MPEQPVRTVATLTPGARQDIRDISRWSELKFGKEAAVGYRALLLQALRDLEADPARQGAKERPELMVPGARTYHLSFSRSSALRPGVKRPRHFILFRATSPGFLEIARILHDSSDLSQHLPENYQR